MQKRRRKTKQKFIPIFYTTQHDLTNAVLDKYVQEFLPLDVVKPISFPLVLYVLDHVHKDYLLPKIILLITSINDQ